VHERNILSKQILNLLLFSNRSMKTNLKFHVSAGRQIALINDFLSLPGCFLGKVLGQHFANFQ